MPRALLAEGRPRAQAQEPERPMLGRQDGSRPHFATARRLGQAQSAGGRRNERHVQAAWRLTATSGRPETNRAKVANPTTPATLGYSRAYHCSREHRHRRRFHQFPHRPARFRRKPARIPAKWKPDRRSGSNRFVPRLVGPPAQRGRHRDRRSASRRRDWWPLTDPRRRRKRRAAARASRRSAPLPSQSSLVA